MILTVLTLCYCTFKNTCITIVSIKKVSLIVHNLNCGNLVHSVQQGRIQNKLSLRTIAYAMKIQ